MNAFGSECSSGCESGWTLYLEQSLISLSKHKVEKKKSESRENEEDLSMVSDASSGPPHLNEDQIYETNNNNNNNNNNKRKQDQRKVRRCEKQEAFLDDTASSQNNFALPNNQASMESIIDYSQQLSTTHFQGRSAYQERYGYVRPSSLSGNQLQNNQWY